MYTKRSFLRINASRAASANPRRDKERNPTQSRSQNEPTPCRWMVVADVSSCLIDRLIDRDVLMCIEAARGFLIRDWSRKENKQKKVNNKGICRVKVSSFVAIRSLSVKTLLQKRISWRRDAELAETATPSSIGDIWVYVKRCRRGGCCCATSMAIYFGMPRSE